MKKILETKNITKIFKSKKLGLEMKGKFTQ